MSYMRTGCCGIRRWGLVQTRQLEARVQQQDLTFFRTTKNIAWIILRHSIIQTVQAKLLAVPQRADLLCKGYIRFAQCANKPYEFGC